MKLISIFLFFLSFNSIASGLSYDYIQYEVGSTNSKHLQDVYSIDISKSIADNYAIKGGISYLYGDWNDPGEYEEERVKSFILEATYHRDINPRTDITASFQFAHSNYELDCWRTSDNSSCNSSYTNDRPKYDYYIPILGLRHLLDNDVEIEGRYKYIKREGLSTKTRQSQLLISKPIMENISLGAEYTWGHSNTTDFYGVFLRQDF